MSIEHERTALARAEFFLSLAEKCSSEQRAEFEAYIDASIIFARAALHRLKHKFEAHPSWNSWFMQLKGDPAVEFFSKNRNFLLKEAPTKIGQIITFDSTTTAAQLYFFEDPSIPATETIRKNLALYTKIILEGEESLIG